MAKEQHFDGQGVAAGIAIGTAYVRESGAVDVPERRIPKNEVEKEQNRLKAAVRLARRQIRLGQARAAAKSGTAGEELTYLLDAYLHMLQDSRLVRGAEQRIADQQINAEAAVKAEIVDIAQVFQAMDDSYIAARVDDIREVGNRLLRNLTKTPIKPFSAAPENSIVIAEQLTPADTAQLDPAQIVGAAAMLGSRRRAGREGEESDRDGRDARSSRRRQYTSHKSLEIASLSTGRPVTSSSTRRQRRSPLMNATAPNTGARPAASTAYGTWPPSPATAPKSPSRPTSSCPSK